MSKQVVVNGIVDQAKGSDKACHKMLIRITHFAFCVVRGVLRGVFASFFFSVFFPPLSPVLLDFRV